MSNLFVKNKFILKKPPPEPEVPKTPTTTLLASSAQNIRQHGQLLNRDSNENRSQQVLLQEGDVRAFLFKRLQESQYLFFYFGFRNGRLQRIFLQLSLN